MLSISCLLKKKDARVCLGPPPRCLKIPLTSSTDGEARPGDGASWPSRSKRPSLLTPRSHPLPALLLLHHTGPWSQREQRPAAQQETPLPPRNRLCVRGRQCLMSAAELGKERPPGPDLEWAAPAPLNLPDSLSQDWILLPVPPQLEEAPLQACRWPEVLFPQTFTCPSILMTSRT